MGKLEQVSSRGAELLSTLPSVAALLPGEDEMEFEALLAAHLAELSPKGAYQASLARDLVHYEWEILRHRRMRDLSCLNKYRELATNVLIKGSPWISSRLATIDEQVKLHVRDLVSSDAKTRREAEEEFTELTAWNPMELLAEAVGGCSAARMHEMRLEDLERRRRQLRDDYRRLQETAPREIEDAELIEEA